ncbi:MAG: DUF2397 family protein, partial [Pseudonocardiaceae bacterium]
AATPWAQAPRVHVSPHLRRSGRVEHTGGTATVRDVRELRRARQHRAAHERAELEAAWGRLSTAGPVRLSQLGSLEHGRFERLLELLGRALGAPPDATGHRRGLTADGRVELVLRAPSDGARATLRTPKGTFTGPDYLVDVRVLAGAPPARAAAGGA